MDETLVYTPSLGIEAGGSVMWWGDWAPDQGRTDEKSLVYETAPLADSIKIMGFPLVKLQAYTNASVANWLVRLSDVDPQGRATQVTGAGFNARHLRSAEHPRDLVPDSLYTITIEMHVASWTFRPGHRIRLAVNNSQWPMIWPTPFRQRRIRQ